MATLKLPRLSDAVAAELSRAIDTAETQDDLFVVADEQLPGDCLQSAISAMNEDPELSGFLVVQRPTVDCPPAGLPGWLAPFVPVESARAALLRPDCLAESQLGGFADVDEPLRELFARMVTAGLAIQTAVIDPVGDDTGMFRQKLPRLRPREPGRRLGWVVDAVAKLPLAELLGRNPAQPEAAAIRAGILQVNDFLDASHSQSQSVEGAQNADYWHAIMHRREPDYSNSKYWFRRVGTHAVFGALATAASALLDSHPDIAASWQQRLLPSGEWDAFAFVDLCASCPRNEEDGLSLFARQLQWIEMQFLLRHVTLN